MSAPLCRHCDAEIDVDNIDQVRALDGCKVKLWVSCGQCERDTAFVLEREADALHDAFRAGAEYMRRETRSLAVVIMPDAQRIDAAAAGYVAGLSGGAS